ncbi:MAG: hypothetical protein K9L64_02455 [Candidatus Izimaplasma sp.]|nr:hypothetical protein [Candidatus Izimaplasma bacterium]
MKRFFGNLYIIFALILVSLVAVPWNNFSVWGLEISFLDLLTNNEFVLKFLIGAVLIIISFIFLLVSNREYKNEDKVSPLSSHATLFPIKGFAFAFFIHTTYMIYTDTDIGAGFGVSNLYSMLLIAGGLIIINILLFSHLFIRAFRKVGNFGRFSFFILAVEFAALSAGLAYLFRTYLAVDYSGMSAKYVIFIIPIMVLFYLFHIFYISRKRSKGKSFDFANEEEEETTDEMIVSPNQDISSKINKVDPKDTLYQEVSVDPEFSKVSNQRNKPNSIEYYIEKPKMFKPLNPSFDKLVAHVRELPNVITKLDDEKITFYVNRRPFLVLMNYGDYYRMAFRYGLEEGIRMIIKYPTISKNKSTRDELWFKANNYGDLPKDVVFKIVKYAYDEVAK